MSTTGKWVKTNTKRWKLHSVCTKIFDAAAAANILSYVQKTTTTTHSCDIKVGLVLLLFPVTNEESDWQKCRGMTEFCFPPLSVFSHCSIKIQNLQKRWMNLMNEWINFFCSMHKKSDWFQETECKQMTIKKKILGFRIPLPCTAAESRWFQIWNFAHPPLIEGTFTLS